MVQQKQCIINELGFVIKVKENITIRFPAWKNNFRNCVTNQFAKYKINRYENIKKKTKKYSAFFVCISRL